jgi:SAM-dependent methyltransferase
VFDTYTEIFRERANSYHSAMKRWPNAREAEFRVVSEPFADLPDGVLCDMPSGGCYLADYLRPGMRYFGVEAADGFFDNGQGQSGERLIAPIVDVPLPDNSVDYVVSLAALHHEPSLPAVFDEMRRLVRTSGRIVIADVEIDTPPARFLNGFVDRNNPRGHDGRFLDERTSGLLEASGFSVIEDALVEAPWSFDRMEDAGAFCSDLFGITGPGRPSTADVLADEIGFYMDGRQLKLRWALRRIVARPS